MIERNIHCRFDWLPSVTDKKARAVGFQSRVSMGRVRFEPGADFGEYLAFPTGRYDDEVDASSLIGRALEKMHPALGATEPKPPAKPSRQDVLDAWTRKWDRAFEEADDEPRGTWMSW